MPMEGDFISKKKKTCFCHRMTPEGNDGILVLLVLLFLWLLYRSYLSYRENPSRWFGETVVNAVIGGSRRMRV